MKNKTILKVRVTTNNEKFVIEGFNEWTRELKIRLTQSPSEGKANKELIEKTSLFLKEKVELVSGHKSTRKKLVVHCDEKTLGKKLSRFN